MNAPRKPGLLPVADAQQRILSSLTPVSGSVCLGLREALGRVLSQGVRSPLDVPPCANSAMDGYAVRHADFNDDGAALKMIGTALAGHPFSGRIEAGQCVRIMTGAKLPDGADTVVMQEETQAQGDTLHFNKQPRQGTNVRLPGEDIRQGQDVLTAGHLLTPADLGLLASLGIAEVSVRRRLRVAFFSTGDELRSLGQPLEEGQIYDSNRYTLHGMLSRLGIELIDMGVIADRREDIAQAFSEAAQMADVLITSGGVSVGEADYVKETLDRIGQVEFWKIAMKPGKPLAFGRLGDTVFFGLPGNPVSSMATFYQLVQPALRALAGQPPTPALRLHVPCTTALKKSPGRADYQRGVLEYDADGQLCVRSTGPQGSHILSSMSQANCFIILPTDGASLPAGSLVEVQPFAGLI